MHFNLITLLKNYDKILIMFFSHTVPSIDSSIPVTIQSVITGNIVEITAFVNVRLYVYLINDVHTCIVWNTILYVCI